ncbi:MAG: VWA domain-containing protein [bacterium]|nr:VWA domain-containing protein [bacterium]
MKWNNTIGLTEFILIGTFIVFYIIFIARVLTAAKQFKNSGWQVIFKLFLRTLYFGLLIAALLGPVFGEGQREVKSIGKDIFIAIDLSQSMNATDVAPSRLERLKYELKNIVSTFSSDKIGLIIFSDEAFLQCPLTDDKNYLSNVIIDGLYTYLVSSSGTDFGPPLEMALEKLQSEEVSVTQPKSKIIVLISDGEDFGDNTEQIAEEIESSEIKLFTLGIGTEKGSKISTRQGFKKDLDGNIVVSKLNPKSLKKLAADTDGKYFEISSSRNDVSKLINTIDDIEGELRDAKKMDVTTNKYFYPLIAALILMLLDVLISIRLIRI